MIEQKLAEEIKDQKVAVNASRFLSCPCCDGRNFDLFYENKQQVEIKNWEEFFYGGRQFFSDILKCKSCDFQWLNRLTDNYVEFYKSQQTTGYEQLGESRKRYFLDVQKMVEEKLSTDFGYTNGILDIGCGDGAWLDLWQGRGDLFGAELNPDHQKALKNQGVSIVSDQDISEETFSMLCLFDFLEHVENPASYLEHLKKSLSPKSALVIGVPDMGKILAKLMGEKYYLYCPMHFSYFRKENLEILLKRIFPEYDVSVEKSPSMRFDAQSVLKWIGLPDVKLGRCNIWSPIGYQASLIAIVKPKPDTL